MDTDILVSTAFAAEASSSQGWAALQRQLDGGAAVVLPAFETQHDVNGQCRRAGARFGGCSWCEAGRPMIVWRALLCWLPG